MFCLACFVCVVWCLLFGVCCLLFVVVFVFVVVCCLLRLLCSVTFTVVCRRLLVVVGCRLPFFFVCRGVFGASFVVGCLLSFIC